ncbi:MAG TPA: hypothetical protein VKA64_00315 [Gammaproteobacteria bacterium]|nr:hypothetical protein [Gammaproteobacteria bacterium]
MKKTVFGAATALALFAFAGPSQAGSAAEALERAEAANERVAEVGYEWRDTGKIIQRAEQALEAGDKGTAMALAEKARQQALQAYEQYQIQKKATADL